MAIIEKIKSALGANKLLKNLWHFEKEPLSPFSLLLLIGLDIFLLSAIYNGIDSEQAKNPYPSSYIPYSCSVHFDKRHTDPAQISYDDFQNDKYSYTYIDDLYLNATAYKSEICKQLDEKLQIITKNEDFLKNKKMFHKLNNEKRTTSRRIEQLHTMYDTRLTEQIANLANSAELEKVKNEFDGLIHEQNTLDEQLKSLPQPSQYDGFTQMREFVNANHADFIQQKKSYEKWYPFYHYFRMLSFVLPLMLLTLLIYRRFHYVKTRAIVEIISANMLVILSIPLFIGTLTLIYDLIPKILLEKLVALLVSIGLLALLKYLIIAFITVIIAWIIYSIQKNAKRKREALQKSQITKIIASGRCGVCTNSVDLSYKFCPSCGNNLKKTCPHCNQETTNGLPHCFHCGGDLKLTLEEII